MLRVYRAIRWIWIFVWRSAAFVLCRLLSLILFPVFYMLAVTAIGAYVQGDMLAAALLALSVGAVAQARSMLSEYT